MKINSIWIRTNIWKINLLLEIVILSMDDFINYLAFCIVDHRRHNIFYVVYKLGSGPHLEKLRINFLGNFTTKIFENTRRNIEFQSEPGQSLIRKILPKRHVACGWPLIYLIYVKNTQFETEEYFVTISYKNVSTNINFVWWTIVAKNHGSLRFDTISKV